MSDNGGISTGSSRVNSFISNSFFDVAYNGTFGYFIQGEYVSNWDGSFSSTIYELTSVGSFSSDEMCLNVSIFIRISEINF